MFRVAPETVPLALVFKSFDVIAEIAREVVVAFVEVLFRAVKFWRVDELLERKPPVRVERPETESDERVPTLVSDEERTLAARVAPVKVPAGAEPVMFPVKFPVALVKKRLVVLAVLAKKLVVVAEVPVPVVKVKDWRVVEPVWSAVAKVEAPETLSDPRVPMEVRDERVVTVVSM